MKYVVGYSADSGGRGALAVGRLFATGDMKLTVCTIVPETWGYPSLARVDAEYAEFLTSQATAALDEAKRMLGPDVPAEYLVTATRSPVDGVLALVEELDAKLVVLGSSRAGPFGRFAVGSVTNSLLHAAPVPVALAPRGHRPPHRTRLQRVSCGYVGTEYSAAILGTAVELAQRQKVPLRLVTGVIRDGQMYPPLVGLRSERLVEQEWRAAAERALRQAVATLPEGVEATFEITEGTDWDDALDALHWEDGEVLVIGSSRLAGVSRIFLGSNASKIVRSSPVPTVVLPRRAAVG